MVPDLAEKWAFTFVQRSLGLICFDRRPENASNLKHPRSLRLLLLALEWWSCKSFTIAGWCGPGCNKHREDLLLSSSLVRQWPQTLPYYSGYCTVLYCENFCSYNYLTSLPHLIVSLCIFVSSCCLAQGRWNVKPGPKPKPSPGPMKRWRASSYFFALQKRWKVLKSIHSLAFIAQLPATDHDPWPVSTY